MAAAMGANQTRARIYFDDTLAGYINLLDSIDDSFDLKCDSVGTKWLKILTENAGRVNFAKLDNNFVGLAKNPQTDAESANEWIITSLPLDTLQVTLATVGTFGKRAFPMFFQASWNIPKSTDNFRGQLL